MHYIIVLKFMFSQLISTFPVQLQLKYNVWLRYVHINIGSQELSANHDILQVLDHVVDPVFSC